MLSRLISKLPAALRRLRPTPPPAAAPAAPAQAPAPPAYMAQFEKAGNRVRDAAKWLLTTFAALGALLLAGTQFSSIGSLEWDTRLKIATGAGCTALLGAAITIWLLLDVMEVSEITISDLEREARKGSDKSKLAAYVAQNPTELLGFRSLPHLAAEYRSSLARRRRATLAYYDLRLAGKPENDADVVEADRIANLAEKRRNYVQACVNWVVNLMAYEQVRLSMSGARRAGLFFGAVVAAAGIGVFAWAANPPKEAAKGKPAGLSKAKLSDAQLTRASLVGANLVGAHLERASLVGADLTGADLSTANLRGADLRGAKVTNVIWKNTICPDGTNSDTHKDGCASHRSPK